MDRIASPLTETHITAWARLVRVSGEVMRAVEAALKSKGLPPLAWYDLLLELKRAGSEGLRPYQLQAEMLIPQYNMSRMIDRMEKAGLVERIACDEDGRGQIVRITTAGREMQRRMWPVYRGALEREFAGRIDAEAAELLIGLLST